MHDTQTCLRKLLSNELLLSLRKHPPVDIAPTPDPHDEDARSMLLKLHEPSCIQQQLEGMGVVPSLAIDVSSSYLNAARQLRAICQSSFREAIKSSNPKNVEAIAQVWQNFYTQQTRAWIDTVLSPARKSMAKPDSATIQPDVKPLFNHEYTPILEQYFEHNAYPSTSDKAVLAGKSNMSLRQIDVWFQNHRNRARKEGKSLRKLTDEPLSLELVLKVRERKALVTPTLTKSDDIYQPTSSICNSPCEDLPMSQKVVCKRSSPSDALDPPRSPLAFPAVYSSPHNSFSASRGIYRFPEPVWHRRPATASLPIQTPVNVDELVKDFNDKLHLGSFASLRQRPKPASKPWWATRVTVPSPAPHPALIRLHVSSTSTNTQPSPVRPAAPATAPIQIFRASSPISHPISAQDSSSPVRRKVARLPRRTPKNISVTHRHSSPVTSSTSSPSRSSSSSSSSPSSSESSTSHNRLTSDSSSSSLASSRPTTPVSGEELHPPAIALPRLELEQAGMFSRYGRSIEPDREAAFSPTFDLHKSQQSPLTFEGLDYVY